MPHNHFIKIQDQDIHIEILGAPALASGSSLMQITKLKIPQLSESTIQNRLFYIQTDAVQIKLPTQTVQPSASDWQAILE